MLTLKEISQDWGCTPQYVSLCVKQGCPKDDFESARLWRLAHTGKASKKTQEVSEKSTIVHKTQEFSKKSFDTGPEYERDPELAGLFKTLKNSALAAENAWLLLDEAFIERKASKISMMLNLHSKAVEARVKAERMVREELERRGVLVPLTEAKTSIRRVVEIVVSRLSALPSNIAPRCNPHNPEHAMEILQEECVSIISDAQKASIA